MTAKCSTCGAEIIWAQNDAGKATPLNAKPRLVAIVDKHPVSHGAHILRYVQGHESHFSTCPQAAQHRKPKQEVLFEQQPLSREPE